MLRMIKQSFSSEYQPWHKLLFLKLLFAKAREIITSSQIQMLDEMPGKSQKKNFSKTLKSALSLMFKNSNHASMHHFPRVSIVPIPRYLKCHSRIRDPGWLSKAEKTI